MTVMQIIHSSLHLHHDGGMELHRGELVPCYEQPARVDCIRQALQADGHAFSEPRDFGVEVLHAVHDPAFVDFLRTAHARWRD